MTDAACGHEESKGEGILWHPLSLAQREPF